MTSHYSFSFSLSLLSSSIGRSGTFCIINIVIERLKVEGMIDIFFTIHALRRKHPGIVANYVSTTIRLLIISDNYRISSSSVTRQFLNI